MATQTWQKVKKNNIKQKYDKIFSARSEKKFVHTLHISQKITSAQPAVSSTTPLMPSEVADY